jgi:hypothetical protein
MGRLVSYQGRAGGGAAGAGCSRPGSSHPRPPQPGSRGRRAAGPAGQASRPAGGQAATVGASDAVADAEIYTVPAPYVFPQVPDEMAADAACESFIQISTAKLVGSVALD